MASFRLPSDRTLWITGQIGLVIGALGFMIPALLKSRAAALFQPTASSFAFWGFSMILIGVLFQLYASYRRERQLPANISQHHRWISLIMATAGLATAVSGLVVFTTFLLTVG